MMMIGVSTNPPSLGSNGRLIRCALRARSKATVEVLDDRDNIIGWI